MHTVSFPNYLHFFCPTKNNCWKIYEPFSPLCYCVKSPKNITYQDPIMWINFLIQKRKKKKSNGDTNVHRSIFANLVWTACLLMVL